MPRNELSIDVPRVVLWVAAAVVIGLGFFAVVSWRTSVTEARAADDTWRQKVEAVHEATEARREADRERARLQAELDAERAARRARADSAREEALRQEEEAEAAAEVAEAAGDSLEVILDTLVVRVRPEILPWVDAAREVHDRERDAFRQTVDRFESVAEALRTEVTELEGALAISDSSLALAEASRQDLLAQLQAEQLARSAAEQARDEWRQAAGVGFFGHWKKYATGAAIGAGVACLLLCPGG